MKEFLILFKGRESLDYSPEELQKRVEAFRDWVDQRLKNHYITSNRLEPEGRHLKGKEEIVTDGPFLEAKEMIAGFVLIRAVDMEQAVRLAQDCPLLDHFEILLRPVSGSAS